jgi:divalent metal cation (Fe/Co/Zn/Cd) transporter
MLQCLMGAGAIACGAIASISRKVWWIDPAGAVAISAYIIWSWANILRGQARHDLLMSSLSCSIS